MPRVRGRPTLLAGLAVAAALTVAACGGDGDPEAFGTAATSACAGVSTGAEALKADGREPRRRVETALERATDAARALARLTPPEDLGERHGEAVHALQIQAGRLRAVRDQMASSSCGLGAVSSPPASRGSSASSW